MSEEKLPVSSTLNVLNHKKLFKSEKWWSETVFLDSFGRKQVAVYLWQNRNGQWKRKQKFVIRNKDHWEQVKESIEDFIDKLP
ncbi:MAG: hypothetical protein ACOC6H_02585 [Thermoproteota archaeon]